MLLQAFARPDIVDEVSSKITPVFTTQDSTKEWLDNWVKSELKFMNNPELQEYNSRRKLQNIGIVNNRINTSQLEETCVKKRNVFVLRQDLQGRIIGEKKMMNYSELKYALKTFIQGSHPFEETNPEYIVKALPIVGETRISQGIITYWNNIIVSPKEIELTIRTIGEAYLEVRKEMSQEKFGEAYFSLNQEKRSVIDQMVPSRVSTAMPKKVGEFNKNIQKAQSKTAQYNHLYWLNKWSIETINNGVYQPDGIKSTDNINKGNKLRLMLTLKNEYKVGNQFVDRKTTVKIVKDFLDGKDPVGAPNPEFVKIELPIV